MKLTADQVYSATLVVAQIIRENRPMPQKGKYWLARLHAKLLPEFNPISERRDAMITAFDYHPEVDGVQLPQFAVPPDKAAEFAAAWKEIGEQEIDADVQPVSLACLDLGDNADGSITASELLALGDLVRDA